MTFVIRPPKLIILCAYATRNVHLLLLSGIGEPYDPETQRGVVGKNYAYQTMSSVDVFTEENLNPFMGAGALGQAVDDFNGNNFDHGPHGFIGGGYIASWTTGGRPIGQMILPDDAPKWGSGWKKAVVDNYLHATSLSCHGSSMAYRGVYLDLHPTYRGAYGNPLLRQTFDFGENDRKMSDFLTDRAVDIAKGMKPTRGSSCSSGSRRSSPRTPRTGSVTGRTRTSSTTSRPAPTAITWPPA